MLRRFAPRIALADRNPAPCTPLACMDTALRKPAIIAMIVAVGSIATLLVINHTNLVVDRRPPPTPPGTTFNAVNGAGGAGSYLAGVPG